MHFTNNYMALALASTTIPRILALPAEHNLNSRSTLTATQLQSIAPTSNTCSGALYPSECRTAAQALPYILQSFTTYSMTTPGAQAAILSTIAFESGDFKYSIHHFPAPIPGQGTRNMQSASFNTQYAASLQVGGAAEGGPIGLLDALVANETYDFGSAAWFLSTQCGPAVMEGLVDGGMEAYMGCIGTRMTPDREAYWQRAIAALGVQFSV